MLEAVAQYPAVIAGKPSTRPAASISSSGEVIGHEGLLNLVQTGAIIRHGNLPRTSFLISYILEASTLCLASHV